MTESSKARECDQGSLLKIYGEMSADSEREQGAWEWCEAHISDGVLAAETVDPRSFP